MFASIVVTTYNRKRLTRHALMSLAKSGISDCEVIVVDNASTDGTQFLLRIMHNDLDIIDKLVLNKENLHVGKSVNQGFDLSESEWLIHFPNDVHFMVGWLDNFRLATECVDSERSYFWCMLSAGRYLRETIESTLPNGGVILIPKSQHKGKIISSGGIALHKSVWGDIRFNESPFNPTHKSPFSVMAMKLSGLGFKFIELGKPCVLDADHGFDNPEFKEYYNKTYSARGKTYVARLARKRKKGGHFLLSNSDNAARYFKGSDYTYRGVHYD